MKKIFIVIIITLFLLPFISESEARSAKKKAPGIALENTEGTFILLSSLLAKYNLILSFWSYDCVPCRKEMPELQKMADMKLLKDKKVKIVFIYVEAKTAKTDEETANRPPKDKAIEILGKLGIKEICLLDIYGVAYKNYKKAIKIKKSPMPLLFLVNQKKEIVFSAKGYNKKNLQRLEKSIEKKL